MKGYFGKFATAALLSAQLAGPVHAGEISSSSTVRDNTHGAIVNCISQSTSGIFGSTNTQVCRVGEKNQIIQEGQTIKEGPITYTMQNGQVRSKADYSKPSVDPKNCRVESYANENGAGSRVICGDKVFQ